MNFYKEKRQISREEYTQMWESQNGLCLICSKKDSGRFGRCGLYIDHNHATGEIRGLLCPKCNTGLGMFNNDINLLLKALKYLEKNSPTKQISATNNPEINLASDSWKEILKQNKNWE